MKKYWYAVQIDSTDAWDDGTYDKQEALRKIHEMNEDLDANGLKRTAQIAVIDEETGFCVDVIMEVI